jgi:hypothetical protein
MTVDDRLLGRFEEFMEWEKQEHASLREDNKDMKRAIEGLRLWRAQVIGISLTLSAIAGWMAGHWRG